MKKKTKYYNELLRYYGKEESSINEVKHIFDKCGVKEYCIDKINELYNESLNILNEITWLRIEDKEILNDLIIYLKNRTK